MSNFKNTFIAAITLGALLCVGASLGLGAKATALSGSDWQAGRIIDDAIFFNPNTMNPTDIQAVLNAKVPVCDTWGAQPYAGTTRADWSTAQGYPPPFICLKDYSQTIPDQPSDSYCPGSVTGGTKSSARIIYDVAQACGVNPKILIVLLQKEQNLVTDDWPWPIQYRSATGYGCPDTAPCDTQYYGFFNQLYNAAHQFQRYVKQSAFFNFAGGQTDFVQYNPNAGCGGTNVFMQNQATAGLYNYTPYQPNQSALNNLYGVGDSCGAYGNRNFWRLYIDWFGSPYTTTPYAWMYESHQIFSDAAMTKPFTSVATVQPGQKIYVQLKARNMGTQTWDQSFLHLGTSHSNDRSSQLYDSSTWINSARPIAMTESTIPPGQIATFRFDMLAPAGLGTYKEYFNLVAENRSWLNDLGAYFTINVNNPIATSSANTVFASGSVINKDDAILSPDKQSALTIQRDGNLVLNANFQPIWSTGPTTGNHLVMQTDGNLVFYTANNTAVWSSNTGSNPGAYLALQTDGNLVIYSSSNSPLWATYTLHNPDHRSYVNITLPTGRMYPGQSIDTADRRYHLIMQTDGNLVLYSPNRAIWATNTDGKIVSSLAMQGDGNLVLYDHNAKPIWYSGTLNTGGLHLTVQQDGNLVLYDNLGQAYWNTQTQGVL